MLHIKYDKIARTVRNIELIKFFKRLIMYQFYHFDTFDKNHGNIKGLVP